MALKIPLDLSENAVLHHSAKQRGTSQPVADAELDALAAAVKTAREEATSLVQVHEAALADRTQSPEAAALQIANAALRSAERTAARIDVARGRVTATIESMGKATLPPAPRDAAALALETEIRAALKAMPSDKERDDAISEAFATKNLSVISAVLRGPGFLTGIGPAKQNMLLSRYRTDFHAGSQDRITRLTKALEATDRAGNLFVGIVTEMSDSPTVRLAAANKLRREEAIAAHQKKGVK